MNNVRDGLRLTGRRLVVMVSTKRVKYAMTSINLDKDTLEKLSIAVYARSISQAELLKEAINTICHDDARLAQAIEKSRSEIARGEFFTQEQVEADNQRLRQEILARKCG